MEDIFRQLEFRTLTQRLHNLVKKLHPSLEGATQQSLFAEATVGFGISQQRNFTTRVVDTPGYQSGYAELAEKADRLAFDTETTSTDPMQAELDRISLAANPTKAYYFPVGHLRGKRS